MTADLNKTSCISVTKKESVTLSEIDVYEAVVIEVCEMRLGSVVGTIVLTYISTAFTSGVFTCDEGSTIFTADQVSPDQRRGFSVLDPPHFRSQQTAAAALSVLIRNTQQSAQ